MVSQWIVDAIKEERLRQSGLWTHEHAWGMGDCSSPDVARIAKVAILTEEVGKVARAVLDCDEGDKLRAELIQVAAVAVAWLETFDGRESHD